VCLTLAYSHLRAPPTRADYLQLIQETRERDGLRPGPLQPAPPAADPDAAAADAAAPSASADAAAALTPTAGAAGDAAAGHAPAAEGAPGALTCAWRMDVRLGLWHMRAPRMHGRPMAIRLFVLQLQVVAMHMPA